MLRELAGREATGGGADAHAPASSTGKGVQLVLLLSLHLRMESSPKHSLAGREWLNDAGCGRGSQAAMEALREEKVALETKTADQEAKLVDSGALLQSNQQMIQWLNQQVREREREREGERVERSHPHAAAGCTATNKLRIVT
jgi:hypothetical protein